VIYRPCCWGARRFGRFVDNRPIPGLMPSRRLKCLPNPQKGKRSTSPAICSNAGGQFPTWAALTSTAHQYPKMWRWFGEGPALRVPPHESNESNESQESNEFQRVQRVNESNQQIRASASRRHHSEYDLSIGLYAWSALQVM